MASVFPHARTFDNRGALVSPARLARAMTWNCSLAVLAYAAVQLTAVVLFADWPAGGVLPFVALAALIIFYLPFARGVERHWRSMTAAALPSDGLTASFRRDRNRLWRLALLGPMVWLAPFVLLSPLAA